MIGLGRAFLDLLQLEHIAAFLADLRDGDDAELKAPRKWVISQHFLPETQYIEVEDMRTAVCLAAHAGKEVEVPERQIARIDERVVRADGIVGDDEAALQDIDEVGLRIRFENVEQSVDFEGVVKFSAVPPDFIAVELPLCVSMPYEP